MKKITSTLLMLVIMLFTINVKASDLADIHTEIYKVGSNDTVNTGTLYNSMPTEVTRNETFSVRIMVHDVYDWTMESGQALISWDKELELVDTNGKYYVVEDNHISNIGLEIAGENRATITYRYEGRVQTNDVSVIDLKFRVKKNAPDGVYKVRQEFIDSALTMEIFGDPVTYERIPAYEKTLKFQVGKTKVSSNITKAEIEEDDRDVYVIGDHMFTRDGSKESGYDGILKTEYIMLASKSIESNNKDDMIIYLKDIFGDWVNAINDNEITPPTSFKINYIDMVPNYGENGVYTNNDESIILRLIQITDKEALVTIETELELVHGIATVNGKVVTLKASGITYTITVGDSTVQIATSDTNLSGMTLNKRTNMTISDYLLNEYTPGVYDGYGSPIHYMKSSHTGTYVFGNYQMDVLRVNENSARVCIKQKNATNCAIDTYIQNNENNYTGYGATTYALELTDMTYGLNYSEGQMNVVCLHGACDGSTYNGIYSKTSDEMTIESALHIWEKAEVQYRVTFNQDNGETSHYIYVAKGSRVVDNPEWEYAYGTHEKEGYVFDKWVLNNQEYNFASEVTGPITLVATYHKLPGTAVLSIGPLGVGHDYISFDNTNDKYTYSLTIELADNYDGFDIFEVNGSEDPVALSENNYATVEVLNNTIKLYLARPYLMVNGNKHYGANSNTIELHPVKYEVTFDSTGGSNVVSQFVPYGEFATEPTGDNIPLKTGFAFVEWLKENGDPFDFEHERINDAITLYASWENNIPTPVVGVGNGADAYEFGFYLANENGTAPDYNDKYCANANGECSMQSTDNYIITGYELYEKDGNNYTRVTVGGQNQFAPYEYINYVAEPNEVKQFVLRAYIKEGAVTSYSEYSAPYSIDTTLQTPTIAFNPTYGMLDPTDYEIGTWVEVTNLMSAFGYDCQVTTCSSYKVNQFEIYNKVGENEYEALSTFGPTGAVLVTANYGETLHLYIRGYKNGSNGPVYTPYSNELVYSPTLVAPVITRSHMGSGDPNIDLAYALLNYDDSTGFAVNANGDYSRHMMCNPNDETDCVGLVDEYEWFSKDGQDLTSVYDGGFGGEATLHVLEGYSVTFVAKAYVNRAGNPKYYSPESNEITIDLTNPTYTFETLDVDGDDTKVMVKGYINGYGIYFDTITVDSTDIADDDTGVYFVTDKSNLENVDTISIKLSNSKSVTATRITN